MGRMISFIHVVGDTFICEWYAWLQESYITYENYEKSIYMVYLIFYFF